MTQRDGTAPTSSPQQTPAGRETAPGQAPESEMGHVRMPDAIQLVSFPGQPQQDDGPPTLTSEPGISSVKFPTSRDLARNTDKQLKALMGELGKHVPLYTTALTEMNKQGYKFVLYKAGDRKIPADIHAVMGKRSADGMFSHEAVTDSTNKRIYIDPTRVDALATRFETSPSRVLSRTIADESVHIAIGTEHPALRPEQVAGELLTMSRQKAYTPAEQRMHAAMVEEVTSAMANMIIDKSWDEPGFQYPANGLDKDLFNYNRTTSIVAKHVYPRMFPGAPINGLGASDVEKNAIRRVAYYMNSKDMKAAVLSNLQSLGLAEKR